MKTVHREHSITDVKTARGNLQVTLKINLFMLTIDFFKNFFGKLLILMGYGQKMQK